MKNIFAVSSKIQRTGLQDMFAMVARETIESLLHPGATAEYLTNRNGLNDP